MIVLGKPIGTWLAATVVLLAIVIAIIQLVPYGRNHTNPPVRAEPQWYSQEVRTLAVRACFNCHSNETEWPWYSSIAPGSWLIQKDVDEGREKLNFSEWNRPQEESPESAETIQKGEMPPWYYVILHRDAVLSSTERETLIQGFTAMFGTE